MSKETAIEFLAQSVQGELNEWALAYECDGDFTYKCFSTKQEALNYFRNYFLTGEFYKEFVGRSDDCDDMFYYEKDGSVYCNYCDTELNYSSFDEMVDILEDGDVLDLSTDVDVKVSITDNFIDVDVDGEDVLYFRDFM